MTCGIYLIKNKQTGKVYVGSSKDIERRWKQHVWQLRNGKHFNYKLQRSWDKHGESEFVFTVLTEVEESSLSVVEQEFIDLYDSWKNGYNRTRDLLKNLDARGRTPDWTESKRKRTLTVTDTGFDGSLELARSLGCVSVSDLLERLGRRDPEVLQRLKNLQ